MHPSVKSIALTTAILAMTSPTLTQAQQADCTVTSRSDAVVLMHCKAGLDDKAWVKAAKAASEPGKACNVWIWEDLSQIPVMAPKVDTDLPKSATGTAVAVWINDSGNLIKLRKVR